MTFSSAVRLGTRLNAWNTIPTVRRRYAVSAAPVSPVTSMSPNWMRPCCRREDPSEARQQRRLAAPARAEKQHERARGGASG